MIQDIQTLPILQAISNLRKRKVLKIVEGTSVYLKVGDPRRIHEYHENQVRFFHLTATTRTLDRSDEVLQEDRLKFVQSEPSRHSSNVALICQVTAQRKSCFS